MIVLVKELGKMKLEAIILAAGPGSRMVELTRGRPKCLLPVGNQSLIWYAITGLRLVGVTRIIILVPDTYENDIKQYCHKEFKSFKDLVLEFVSIPTKADCGTAESILGIKEKISGDFIVHSCDSIVEPKALSYLVNHYRLYDPMLSMLLSDDVKYFESKSAPGRREKERYMRDVIAVEPLDKLELTSNEGYTANKVVFLHSERDLKQTLKIKNRELALHPSIEVYSRFLDSHIYIFKREMLNFMEENTNMAVLKGEMIPLLVSKQFSRFNRKTNQNNLDDDDVGGIRASTKHSEYEVELREKLASFNPRQASRSTYFQKATIPTPSECHALIVKGSPVFRVNTVASFLDSNRESKSILNAFSIKIRNMIKDCPVGENTTTGDKCIVKRGSIGGNCKIGDKVKLFDCVIMDNVEIESNTSLSECIVGSSSKIGAKCDLKSCIVGYRQIIASGRKASSEVIIEDGYAIDLGDPLVEDDE